jgi:hypothetical protein
MDIKYWRKENIQGINVFAAKNLKWNSLRLNSCLCVAKPANIKLRYGKTSVFPLHALSCYQTLGYELFCLEETFWSIHTYFSLLLLSALLLHFLIVKSYSINIYKTIYFYYDLVTYHVVILDLKTYEGKESVSKTAGSWLHGDLLQ